MSTSDFYNKLLTYIDEAQSAINKPEASKILGSGVLNTLTSALEEMRRSTEEEKDEELAKDAMEAEMAAEDFC